MDCCDRPRQVILKRKRFPTQVIAIKVGAAKINFSKEKDPKKREEIVVNIRFLFDLLGEDINTEINENRQTEEIDYKNIEFRFHLPKRYQDAFENAYDWSYLHDATKI